MTRRQTIAIAAGAALVTLALIVAALTTGFIVIDAHSVSVGTDTSYCTLGFTHHPFTCQSGS